MTNKVEQVDYFEVVGEQELYNCKLIFLRARNNNIMYLMTSTFSNAIPTVMLRINGEPLTYDIWAKKWYLCN